MTNTPLLAAHDCFISVHGHGRQHYKDAGSGDPLILIHTNGASSARICSSLSACIWACDLCASSLMFVMVSRRRS